MAEPRNFYRCPCCGARRPRPVYVAGALAQHVLGEVLTQHFRGAGRGLDADGRVPVDDNGHPLEGRRRGAFQWTRRAPTIEELEFLGLAVAMAGERIARRLKDGELPIVNPAAVLAAVDNKDFAAVATHLLDKTRAELKEREALVEAEIMRREGDKR